LPLDPSSRKRPSGDPDASAVETQLERILDSAEFRKSPRMCRFLRLVTSETLHGNAATLKEYKIGTEVFDKDESFDPRLDPIVRNEARRLRRKLEHYYLTDGKSDWVLIQLPRGGYIPVFEAREPTHKPVMVAMARRWRRLAWSCAIVAMLVLGWWLVGSNRFPSVPARANSRSTLNRSQPMGASGEAYSLGRYLLLRLRAQDIPASRTQLEKAIRLDPSFAEALALLAVNYQVSVVFGLISREEGIAKSRYLAEKAAALHALRPTFVMQFRSFYNGEIFTKNFKSCCLCPSEEAFLPPLTDARPPHAGFRLLSCFANADMPRRPSKPSPPFGTGRHS
jgi:hypothetical protein